MAELPHSHPNAWPLGRFRELDITRLPGLVPPEALARIEAILSRHGMQPGAFFSKLGSSCFELPVRVRAIVLFPREYRLTGHLASRRVERFEFFGAAYTSFEGYRPGRPLPPIGLVVITDRLAVARAAGDSLLFDRLHSTLDGLDEEQVWLCLADDLPTDWVASAEAGDEKLFLDSRRREESENEREWKTDPGLAVLARIADGLGAGPATARSGRRRIDLWLGKIKVRLFMEPAVEVDGRLGYGLSAVVDMVQGIGVPEPEVDRIVDSFIEERGLTVTLFHNKAERSLGAFSQAVFFPDDPDGFVEEFAARVEFVLVEQTLLAESELARLLDGSPSSSDPPGLPEDCRSTQKEGV